MSDFSEDEQHSQPESDEEWQQSDNNESANTSANPSPITSDDEDVNDDEEANNNDGNEPNWQETYDPIDVDPFIQNTGPTNNLGPNANELDHFKLFFNDIMLENIVAETNRYASQNGPDPNWTDTNAAEISAFLGALILNKLCV